MQTSPKITFHLIIKENGRTVRSFAVYPDGIHMVAVAPKTLRTGVGPILPYGYKDNDVLVGGVRYRLTGRRPDGDFEAVAWTPDLDD